MKYYTTVEKNLEGVLKLFKKGRIGMKRAINNIQICVRDSAPAYRMNLWHYDSKTGKRTKVKP